MAQDFQSRLEGIFGALDQHDPQASGARWAINDFAVQCRGRDVDTESDDEDEHIECIEVLRRVEEEEGDALGKDKLPSSSACKAFEKEEEEDEFDMLACDSLRKLRCRPKPALKTQVADRNIYDRILATPMSPSSPCNTTTPTVAQLDALRAPDSTPRSDRKKVRFRETDEDLTVLASTPSSATNPGGSSPRVRRKLLKGDTPLTHSPSFQAASPSIPTFNPLHQPPVPSAPPQISPSHPRSYVPEHVRRPEAFTCYALDEPVFVGSGSSSPRRSATPAAAALTQATTAAAEYLPIGSTSAAPPASEAGAVQFVPPSARMDDTSDQAPLAQPRVCPQRARQVGAVSDSDMENEDAVTADPGEGGQAEDVEPMDVDAAAAAAGSSVQAGSLFTEKAPRSGRKFRTRSNTGE